MLSIKVAAEECWYAMKSVVIRYGLRFWLTLDVEALRKPQLWR